MGWFVWGSHSERCWQISKFGTQTWSSHHHYCCCVHDTSLSKRGAEIYAFPHLFPHARIIWSDILLREAYKNEKDPGAGKRVTKDLNKNAKEQLQPVPNAHIIKNVHIFHSGCGLYDDGDDTHPNAIGMDVL